MEKREREHKRQRDEKISSAVTKVITSLAIVGSSIDFITLSISSITGKNITDSKLYHGIIISILCYSLIWVILKILKIKIGYKNDTR